MLFQRSIIEAGAANLNAVLFGQPISPTWFERMLPGDHSDIGNYYDRGGIGDLNLRLAHQFMTNNLGLPLTPIPGAYAPVAQNLVVVQSERRLATAPLPN